MLFNTVLLSLLVISVTSAFASPVPTGTAQTKPKPSPKTPPKPAPKPLPDHYHAANDNSYALAARDVAGLDVEQMPFEKRSLIHDVSGGMEVVERDLGDENLELYIRDLEDEQALLERSYLEEPDLERRKFSFGKFLKKAFKTVAKIVMKRQNEPAESEIVARDLSLDQQVELLGRDVAPEAEVELFERDFEPEAEMEILERDFEPEAEAELFERDFEPEEMEVFERDFEAMEDFEDLE